MLEAKTSIELSLSGCACGERRSPKEVARLSMEKSSEKGEHSAYWASRGMGEKEKRGVEKRHGARGF